MCVYKPSKLKKLTIKVGFFTTKKQNRETEERDVIENILEAFSGGKCWWC